ncbi:MAG: 4-(cytidine 5'-diphospho)-2-C-methyl-D-erythritol kinase [Parachlamydiales bacterium]|nr:4-(cytidine 5'-diphospho)-2-C-methyl-D-erythritol kinase [Parachlamydiales bacterium]
MSALTLFSPAKVNLFFSVIAKREDDYHEIASLYQAISLADRITFSFHSEDVLLTSHKEVPKDRSNLILQAVDLFRKKTNRSFGLKIELEKHIPIGGGLGGGSSNCATTLWALNDLLNTKIPSHVLAQWGSELGSDIPFFFSLGTAYCSGRGEKVREISNFPSFEQGWIVIPPFGMSTKEVYRQTVISSFFKPEDLLQSFFTASPIYQNDLEKAAFVLDPRLSSIKNELLSCYDKVVMSGSGSSFFCLRERKKSHVLTKYLVKPVQRKSESWYCIEDQ